MNNTNLIRNFQHALEKSFFDVRSIFYLLTVRLNKRIVENRLITAESAFLFRDRPVPSLGFLNR